MIHEAELMRDAHEESPMLHYVQYRLWGVCHGSCQRGGVVFLSVVSW